MRVLIVEDDLLLGDALQIGLREQGIAAEWLRDGRSADEALRTEDFAALVLDIGLPRMDGLQLLRRMRARDDRTPVLLLTARDAIDDRVRGLDAGADDYVVKPVALAELAARLRALARRSLGQASPVLSVGSLLLELAAHRVTFRGNVIELSVREFAVLHELMANAGRVLTREQLEVRLYEWDRALESNAIEVHIHHLRKKIEPDIIHTVRGVGYLMPRTSGGPVRG
jgi:two-component system OmpR family response regulator/two-component system response regulator QseB